MSNTVDELLKAHTEWVTNNGDEGHRLDWLSLTNDERIALYRANLTGANLTGANLDGANLDRAKNFPDKEVQRRRICPDGEFTAYKKLADGSIAVLRIPADAARVGGVTGRKCRVARAVVVSGNGRSAHDGAFVYCEGETVVPDSFDPNPVVECSHGIHFFITRLEAEEYDA